jgi:MFS family permease
VLIAAVYPVGDRPAAFGALSAAWVVPGLVGPALAGFVTQQFGWRWIFLGLAPLPLLAMLLLVGVAVRAHGGRRGGDEPQRPGLSLAALGAAAGLSAVTWAAQHPSSGWLALGFAIGGLVALAPALRRLLPAGTLAARPGIPVSVLARGLLAGAFFGVQAYLPLTLTSVHGYSPTEAGLPLTLAAVGWAVASNTQKRLAGIPKGVIVRWAFLGLAPALATLSLIATPWGPAWLAAPLWGLAGVAMGLGYPAVNLLVLELSPANERGFNAAALQIADMLGSATLVGFGGVLFAAFASTERPTTAVVPFNLLMGAVALTGAALFARRR